MTAVHEDKKHTLQQLLDETPEPLKSKGWIRLPFGSVCTWMYYDWLKKAVDQDIIRQDPYGHFVAVAVVRKHDDKETLDFSLFNAFIEKYYAYEAEMRRTGKMDDKK